VSGAPVVLLVDDEVHILSSLRRSLRREGWTLLTADGPDPALALLRSERIDLVVSDQKMPGGSGLALLARARELAPGARRVLLTGWPEMLGQAELARAGIDAVLPKPWEDEDLKETLRRLIQPSG